MIFARLILLALISVALANPLLGDVHRRRADVPGGFTAGGFAPQDDTITVHIALAQRDFRVWKRLFTLLLLREVPSMASISAKIRYV